LAIGVVALVAAIYIVLLGGKRNRKRPA
jgi:hypothetical protein